MSRYTGGCLCRALHYEAEGDPRYAGHCYCVDCRRASGSGFIPFIAFSRSVLTIRGATLTYRSKSARGGDAVRNSCAVCGGLVFGGELELSDTLNIYAGSLDDPFLFHPTIAIFARDRPPWALIPPGLAVFDALPT